MGIIQWNGVHMVSVLIVIECIVVMERYISVDRGVM
jgi:hypothetical protein